MTPALLRKVVHAGVTGSSFKSGAQDLKVLAEADISSQRVRRAVEQIGNQRAKQTSDAKATYDAMHLPARQQCPEGVTPPQVACVQMDGGRIQIRQRILQVNEAPAKSKSEQAESDSSSEPQGYWRESKVGCLLSMSSQESEHDPTPVLPAVFTDKVRMKEMCNEIKGFSAPDTPSQESVGSPTAQPAAAEDEDEASHQPHVISRSIVASKSNSHEFGLQLAAAAYREGFNATLRKSFVCDGQSANWKVWERWFSHYTPIVDFVHAVCYVYAAAMAGRSPTEGWLLYRTWAQWLWQGDVQLIIAALVVEQERIGKPAPDESTTSAKYTIARALTYLRNQRERMNYPDYRRRGLPITSSHIESTIKQVNKRVKGTEKFWDRATEAILHLTADYIGSQTEIEKFWAERPQKIASVRVRHPNQQTLAKAA